MTPVQTAEQSVSLLNVEAVARMVSLSVRAVWRMVSTGQFPKPVRIGRSTRWRRSDVEAWIDGLRG